MATRAEKYGKTKASNTDFSLESRDVQLLEEYTKNQEKRNKLHEKENELLSKRGSLSKKEYAQVAKIQEAYKGLSDQAAKLHAIAKQLDTTQDNIKRNTEQSVDAWSSLSEIYKSSKEELQEAALKSVKLKDVSASIASNETLTYAARKAGLNQIDKFSDGMSSLSTKSAELAGLTADDVEKRAILKSRISDEIALYQQQLDVMQKMDTLDAQSIGTMQEIIKTKQDELHLADQISSQTKLQKQVQEELHESLEGFQKTLLKVRSGVTMLFSGWKGATSLVLFGAGEIAEAYGEMGKELGVGVTEMNNLKTSAGIMGAILGDNAKEAVIDMAKELGDANHITAGMAIDAGTLAANYGLSGEQAAYMATIFGHMSGNSEETGNNTREMVKQMALSNGIMPSEAFKDIANNSEVVATYTKGTGANIGEAAIAAAKLGVNLETAGKVADHLLDYQNSVNDEMEASVILGRDLNLSKARELAYNGDIAGSLKEGLKAMGGIHAYNAMDPYERAASAKALGVSQSELQKMVAHEEDLKGMHGPAIQAYSRMGELFQYMGNTLTGKVLKGMGGLVLGAGQYSKALSNISQGPLGGVIKKTYEWIKATRLGNALSTGASAVGGFAKNAAKKVGGFLLGGMAKKLLPTEEGSSITGPLTKAGLPDKRFKANKITESTKSIADKAKDSIKNKATDAIKDKISPEGVTASAEKAGKGDNGEGFKAKAENIAAGIKSFGDPRVFIGALALPFVGAGLLLLLPGLPTLWLLSKMDLETAGEGLMSLAIGVGFMGTGPVFLGALGLVATAIGLATMLIGIPALIALAAFGELAGFGLEGLAIGLESLGAVAATGLPFVAVGLIAAFGVALIPLTYALSLLAPLVTAVGQAISTVFTSMANAFVTIANVLPTMVANFMPLIGMILPIFGLAAAVGALSLSLLMLGTMGLVALPVLAALGGLGQLGGMLGLGGGGGNGDKQDEMIALLKSIDSKTGGGAVLNVDGKKFAEAGNTRSNRQGSNGAISPQ